MDLFKASVPRFILIQRSVNIKSQSIRSLWIQDTPLLKYATQFLTIAYGMHSLFHYSFTSYVISACRENFKSFRNFRWKNSKPLKFRLGSWLLVYPLNEGSCDSDISVCSELFISCCVRMQVATNNRPHNHSANKVLRQPFDPSTLTIKNNEQRKASHFDGGTGDTAETSIKRRNIKEQAGTVCILRTAEKKTKWTTGAWRNMD